LSHTCFLWIMFASNASSSKASVAFAFLPNLLSNIRSQRENESFCRQMNSRIIDNAILDSKHRRINIRGKLRVHFDIPRALHIMPEQAERCWTSGFFYSGRKIFIKCFPICFHLNMLCSPWKVVISPLFVSGMPACSIEDCLQTNVRCHHQRFAIVRKAFPLTKAFQCFFDTMIFFSSSSFEAPPRVATFFFVCLTALLLRKVWLLLTFILFVCMNCEDVMMSSDTITMDFIDEYRTRDNDC